MQVTQNNEQVTHAVIGGGEVMDFGISNDPTFFHILSSTLYTDSKLAVVRETVCNAWDAHIESETDQPIAIELTAQELVIRDFGNGIPADMIQPIYGIYGGSTKKNDGNQTGGFGLGCKAPFSYTDTFTVTSWNQGVKTVYVMSKSSSEVMGKPSIRPIIDVPTDQTGIEVRIPIKSIDIQILRTHIKQVIYFGGIKATLNSQLLPTLSYPTEHGFIAGKVDSDLLHNDRTIYVKYGNVIYPIPTHEDYAQKLDTCRTALQNSLLSGKYSERSFIILEAPADSISVTPSREALSLQGNTVKTVTDLLNTFSDHLFKAKGETQVEVEKIIKDKITASSYSYLFTNNWEKTSNLRMECEETIATSHSQVCRAFYASNQNYINWSAENKFCLQQMLRHNLINVAVGKKYYRDRHSVTSNHAWLLQNVWQPVIKRLPEGMAINRLYSKEGNSIDGCLESLLKPKRSTDSISLVNHLRKVIVITYLKDNYTGRLYHQSVFKIHRLTSHLVYHVARSPAKVKQAIDFFTKFGFQVVDLTVAHPDENASVVLPESRVARPTYKKVDGLPVASAALVKGHTLASVYADTDVERITNPEWVTKFTNNKDDRMHHSTTGSYDFVFDELQHAQTVAYVLELFGSVGGIAKTTLQLEAYKKKGAVNLSTYLFNVFKEALTNDAETIAYFANVRYTDTGNRAISTITGDKTLCAAIGITYVSISEETEKGMYVLRHFLDILGYRSPRRNELQLLIDAIEPTPQIQIIKDKLITHNQSNEASFYDLYSIFGAIQANGPSAIKARELITNFLK